MHKIQLTLLANSLTHRGCPFWSSVSHQRMLTSTPTRGSFLQKKQLSPSCPFYLTRTNLERREKMSTKNHKRVKLCDIFLTWKDKLHIWTKLHGNVSVLAVFVTTEMILCYGVREHKRDKEQRHKRDAIKQRCLSCQGTQSSVESITTEIQDTPAVYFTFKYTRIFTDVTEGTNPLPI